MANIEKFPVRHEQRELNRRGKMALNCIVSDRWIRVGKPDRSCDHIGTPIELEIMAAYSPTKGSDRKLCGLTITVDQLRALLAEIDKA